jgi:hypothetical protein
MSFSGGGYDECARWLWNFLLSHAKRVDARAEVDVDAGDEREGKSYAARVRLGDRVTAEIEFDYADVAANRGRLAWCMATADRVRALTRELAGEPSDARAR